MKAVLFLAIFFQAVCFARSGGGGNGGDYIRMKFIEVGNFVLLNYKQGLEEVSDLTSIEELRATLDINVIKVSDELLIDNGNSLVDAIGEKNKIILFRGNEKDGTGWHGLFKRSDMVEKLVLHEMLRAVGVNDDNYIYSSKILRFYDSEKYNHDFYVRWCSETAGSIDHALKRGMLTRTYKEEIKIYSEVIKQIKSMISPKHFYFVEPVVSKAMIVLESFKSERSQVNYLRDILRMLAKDIRYIDSKLKSKDLQTVDSLGDNSKHAVEFINTALRFTLYANSNESEKRILNIVLDQVYHYMLKSDFARTKYRSVFPEIDSARYSESVFHKRQGLQYIKNLL
ncbi:MAG: hypothetical protein KC478_09960, partial [Bacteriovoracaceae bacterium]|nr:hypothetical protein [Bacteriovoracaceae bacterium]